MQPVRSYIRGHPRAACACAFGLVTLAVQHFVWTPDARTSGLALYLTIAAGLAHAIAGAITGRRLVDRQRTPTGAGAMLLGAGTSLLALLLFAPLFAGYLFATDTHPANAWSYAAFPILIALFAFLADGWALLVVCAAVGWGIYRAAGPNSDNH